MEKVVLGFYAIYVTLAVGGRMALQRARTGSSGFVGVRARFGSVEWLGGALFVAAYALGIASPLLSIAAVDPPLLLLGAGTVRAVGVALFGLGMALTLWAQLAMGASWRIGVDERERTALVRRGPFAVVRNPIFSAMLLTQAGIAACMPSASAIAAALGLLISVEVQVRVVEEPYLARTHGAAYAAYRRRVGRFVPLLT